MTKIGFVGLGNMGLPMAVNLVKSGHEVTGLDLSEAAKARFTKLGGKVAENLAEVLDGAEVIVSMLPQGRHVRSIYLGDGGLIALAGEGALLIDCSTIDVEASREVAAHAEASGFAMVDAPVSGGTGGAEAGTLTFMVGGSDEAFGRAEPYLALMGKKLVHCGGAGTGQAAKICNNMVLGVSMIAVSEAFALADRLGLDRQKLFDVASTSSGQCWSLTTYCPVPGPVPTSPANQDYQPGFTSAMMLKDLTLAQEAAGSVGLSASLGAKAYAIYRDQVDGGQGELDFSSIFDHVK